MLVTVALVAADAIAAIAAWYLSWLRKKIICWFCCCCSRVNTEDIVKWEGCVAVLSALIGGVKLTERLCIGNEDVVLLYDKFDCIICGGNIGFKNDVEEIGFVGELLSEEEAVESDPFKTLTLFVFVVNGKIFNA